MSQPIAPKPIWALALGIVVAASTSAQRTIELSALQVADSPEWVREDRIAGPPNGLICEGSANDWAAQTGAPSAPVHIFNSDPYSLGPNEVVDQVWVDVLARFGDGNLGPLEVDIRVSQQIDPSTPRVDRFRQCIGNTPAGNCRWQLNQPGSPNGVSIFNRLEALGYPLDRVNELDIFVRAVNPNCAPNSSRLRVKATRLVIETIIDCNGNGTDDGAEILAHPELDLNGNSILDECESAGTPYCQTTVVSNSTGDRASLVAIGSSSIAQNSLELWCGNLPVNSNGYFLVSQATGIVFMAGGSQGTLCIAGPGFGRYAQNVFMAPASGTISFGVDPLAIPQPMGPVAAVAGETWNFQCWYRDNVNGTQTSNHSNAVAVTFTP